ncbi:sensor histidine kinase [Cellulomonas sp. CW35]|uniref:sensor histidine kinase n=1 Tax=Cellulomonas sp. CW35 TaxID=3458249 RepID=UPI000AE70310
MSGTRRTGIAARLLVAMVVVLASATLVAWAVASVVGPALFHQHMAAAHHGPGTAVEHAELAFSSASTVTLAAALGAAAVTALLASTVLARRIGTSLGALSAAAGQVAAGRFDIRLDRPGAGSEFDDLADAFNAMAERLRRDDEQRRRLMSDVAHELRTPVATIVAYVDALEDGVQELDPRTVDVLRAQASRLTRLSTDLAAVAHAEGGGLVLDRRPVAAGDLVAAAVAGVQARAAENGVEVEACVPAGLPPVVVDVDRVGQVLANLLDNAVRHTAPRGRVVVTAEAAPLGVRLRVDDDGEGIAPEHVPHVFERFYRVDTARDRSHGGSGIGLAVVKALTEAHGGRAGVSSDGPGRGARFWVDLPADR